jgi:hypothetical protein
MRKVGLVAFMVTTGVLVPAALHHLTAGPNQVAKLIAPGARTITVAGAKIDASVDRNIIDPGGQIHVTLRATGALAATSTGKNANKVTVDLLVMEARGSDGGRVDNPPDRIARKTITLDVAPEGGAAQTLAFTLPGFRGQEMDGVAPFGDYTILIMPTKLADQLERLRRKAEKVGNPMADETGQYGNFENAYYSIGQKPDDGTAPALGAVGETARLDVQTRPDDAPIALRMPEAVHPGEPFTVTVTVKNPTKKHLDHVGVNLGVPSMLNGDYLGLPEDQITIEAKDVVLDLKPKETKTVTFTVTAKVHGTIGLYARTQCESDTEYQACAQLNDGALDATDVVDKDNVPRALGLDDSAPVRPAGAPIYGIR